MAALGGKIKLGIDFSLAGCRHAGQNYNHVAGNLNDQDSQAGEQRLAALRESGELARFRYIHLATHGEANRASAFESALVLAQDRLPSAEELASGAPFYDGRLTAAEVLQTWKGLEAELVTLSACESGLGRAGGGEGFLGFAQALLLAGSRSVCLSLWKVDDTATALVMDRFYQNLLGRREGLRGRCRRRRPWRRRSVGCGSFRKTSRRGWPRS